MKAIFSLLALCVLSSQGCRSSSSPARAIVLDVATIDAPGTIAVNQPLDLVLSVERGVCQRFDSIFPQRTQSGIVLTVMGSDPEKGCTEQLLREPHAYRVDAPLPVGTFNITVNRAHQTPLTTSVVVH